MKLNNSSMRSVKICVLVVLGIAVLVGCSSRLAEPPVEAAPAPAVRAATALESVLNAAPKVVSEAAGTDEGQSLLPATSETMPAYDSSMPAVAPPSSVEGSSDAGTSSTDTPDSLMEPVAPFVEISDQSDLFVEREAIDALGDDLFLEIITPTEDVVFVESPAFVLTARTVLDAAVSINDDLVDINEEGVLEFELALEEGPNLIEVVTSLPSGQEKSAVLTIFYLP